MLIICLINLKLTLGRTFLMYKIGKNSKILANNIDIADSVIIGDNVFIDSIIYIIDDCR